MAQQHIPLLRCFDELKFNLGRKTLVEFLKGDLNATIEKNSLDELSAYGSLFQLTTQEIFAMVNDLEKRLGIPSTTFYIKRERVGEYGIEDVD